MIRIKSLLFVTLLSISVNSFSASIIPPDSILNTKDSICFSSIIDSIISIDIDSTTAKFDSSDEMKIDSIISFAKTLIGLPYRYGRQGPSSFDCSGYISYIFNNFEYKIPCSSSGLAALGKDVSIENLRKGDLLFFKGRNASSKRVGHVAMVVEVDDESFYMIHACNRGVIIDRFIESSYYKPRLIMAKRLEL